MTDGSPVFRKLEISEENAGYAVICDSVRWQKARGIDLWEQPLPREIYSARHVRGENFAFFVGGEIAVVASLVADVPAYWQSEVGNAKAAWICTVATADRFHGRRAGEEAMKAALAYLAERGDRELWLARIIHEYRSVPA